MPINLILSALLATGMTAGLNTAALDPSDPSDPANDAPTTEPLVVEASPPPPQTDPQADAPVAAFTTARALLVALAERDAEIDVLTGNVRLTAIQVLQGDRQRRLGRLALRTVRTEAGQDRRLYAVSFSQLQIDARVQDIQEEYIFDGRWFVERHPEELQFIKREVVPVGQTLDPMDLMRDAPFWVSVGDDADLILADYDAVLFDAEAGIAGDPELEGLLRFVPGTVQLKLVPKPGSPGEDDWESVRMWFEKDTLLPRLYVKTEWTGDRQIAELFEVETNTEVPAAVFDTTTPDPGSGWQVQVSPWRGKAEG